MENINHILVTAAIIEKDGKILIAKRDKDDPLKDKWRTQKEQTNSAFPHLETIKSHA